MINVNKENVLDTVIYYGKEKQLTVAIEEMSELTKEVCKFIRGKGSYEHICEEVADVYIMLENIKAVFGIQDEKINEFIELKQIRTIERMQNE